MSLVVSIARDEPLCIKASADAAAAWGRNEKGYGFWDRGTMEYPGGRSFEITLHVAVRPNANFAEFARFPLDLEISGHLNDDDAPVGVFAIKRGKATVAIMVPALQGELEMNLDEPIELDRVVLATGTGAHVRMTVSIRVCSAPAETASDAPGEAPLLVQAEIPVAVQGTAHASGSAASGARTSETFVEQTTTAIVFAHGAVVRLAKTVAPGQILILKHLASKAESACRVVSVKSSPSVKGFVELEFLQAAPNFWGTALQATVASKSTSAAVARPEPAAASHKIAAVPKPVSPVSAARPARPVLENAKSVPAAAARHVYSKMLEAPAANGEALHREKPKAAVAEAAPPAPVAAEPAMAAPVMTEPAPVVSTVPAAADNAAPPVAAQPAIIQAMRSAPPGEAVHSVHAAVSEPAIMATEETKPAPVIAVEPLAPANDAERAIPIQLAPIFAEPTIVAPPAIEPALAALASNAAPAPDAALDPAPVEDTLPVVAALSAPDAAASALIAPDATSIPAPTRTTPARSVEPKTAPARSASPVLSGAGLLSGGEAFAWNKNDQPKRSRAGGIAVAAALILAVAGVGGFYLWQQRTRFDSTLAAPNQPILAASTPAPATAPASGSIPDSNAPLSATPPAANAQPSASGAASSTGIGATAKSQTSARGTQPDPNAGSAAAKPRSVSPPESTQQFATGPEVAEMNMPAPTAAARSTNQTAPSITRDAPGGVQDASAGAILSDAAQPDRPAAPAPVRTSSGAQQPRLLSGPAPVYPYAARAEHVQGDVSVDVFIDEFGKVASMTVVSGPALLRPAALDALRHRKYLPAVLDGKATSAHITVVVHFQL